MTQVALVIDNVAVNVEPDQATANVNYHPEIASQFVSVPDTVRAGWIKAGGTWGAPPDSAAAVPIPPVLTPMLFYLTFTAPERIAIKASTDPMVVEFWATYQLAAQTDHPIDMGLVSVVEGVEYLATTTPPLIAAGRVAQILAGQPQ